MPNSASVAADIKRIQADEAQLVADTATLVADAAASVVPVTPPPVTPPPSGTVTPAYEPPGGVGTLAYNFDASTLPNGTLNSPLLGYWYNNTGSMNDVKLSASNVGIVNGQLVLTLSNASNGGSGGAVTTSPWVGAGGASKPFTFTYGYIECSIVVPAGGWWAIWTDGQVWPTDGEFDIAENGGGVDITTNYHSGTGSIGGGSWSPQPAAGSTIVVGGLWQPGVCTSYRNGVQQKQLANGNGGITVANVPQCLILNMGWNSGSSNGDQLKINYLRVWAAPTAAESEVLGQHLLGE